MGNKMATGQKLEPKVIKGKAGSIPVNVQAAHDGANLYLRFTWKQPAGGAEKMDADNQVKLAFMLANDGLMIKSGKKEVEHRQQGWVWGTCHEDWPACRTPRTTRRRSMSRAATSRAGGSSICFSGRASRTRARIGHVADKREMTGGSALVEAKGDKKGDTWTVTFTRKLAGGTGDVALAAGKTVNFGMAIHDDHTHGRFHHVSMGYSLGIDAKADIAAVKQSFIASSSRGQSGYP